MSPEDLERVKQQLRMRHRYTPSRAARPPVMATRTHRHDRAWYHRYHDRMVLGLETCRICRTNENLTFGHDVAHANGGSLNMDNCTIMCSPCNKLQGTQRWHGLVSLAAEKALIARCTGLSCVWARPRMIRLRDGHGPRRRNRD